MKTKILTTLAFAAFATAGLQANDKYMQTRMINEVIPGLVDCNYTIHATELTPIMDEGALHTYTIPTQPGDEIALVAVGDWDANDIDLYVQRAGSDELISRDVQDDDTPVCEFVALGGTYVVSVRVVDADRPAYVRVVFASK